MSKESKQKIKLTLLILLVIQILSNIPIFGINRDVLTDFLTKYSSTLGFFSLFSGNALSQMSLFVIGIAPYITASIVMQLLRVIIPPLEELSKDGKVGQEKYKKITYIVAGILAILQSIPVAIGFASYGLLIENNAFYITIVSLMLILGSVIQIILGNVIDKKGIGNGISLILLMNILSRLPNDVSIIYEMFILNKKLGNIIITILICCSVVIFTFVGIIYLQDGERRIKTQFASQVKGIKSMTGQASNYIPLKVNLAGVMPIIFTSSVFQMYIMIVSFCNVSSNSIFQKIANTLNSSNWFQLNIWYYNIGFILYCILIFAFAYFYSTLVFDPHEVANNLKNSGGIIHGIRPGKPTEEYLTKRLKELRTVGSICLIVVTTIPMIISSIFNVHGLSFAGTSIIIIVGVILETYKLIETERLESKSSSFLF